MTDPLTPFWTSVLSPYVEHRRPHSTLLVGGGDGALLRHLLDLTLAHGGLLHVADPAPAFDIKAVRQQGGDSLVLHPAPGCQAASLLAAPDLLLLNGQANFYAAHSVLHAVQDQADRQGRAFPVTLAGNTAWPYGRRDHYPDPGTVPERYRHPFVQAGLRPDRKAPCTAGGLFADRIHATGETEPGNGVLTALEEFVASQSAALGLARLPVGHGLAVIHPLADRSEAVSALLAAIAMGAAARDALERAELARWTLEADLAERHAAGQAARQHIDKLGEALRREQMQAAELRGTRIGVPDSAGSHPGARKAAGLLVSAVRARLRRRLPAPAEATDAADIARLQASPILDGAWYLRQYGDVAASRADPASHYYTDGAREGRDPGPQFSTSFYLERNPDVAEAGRNPLLHYLRSGAREGRDPGPHFDSRHYLATYPDVAEAGHNPLEHYLSQGRAEGRSPLPPS